MGKEYDSFKGYTPPYERVLRHLPDYPDEGITNVELRDRLIPDEPNITAQILTIRVKRLRQWSQAGGYDVISEPIPERPGSTVKRYYKKWIGEGIPPIQEVTPDHSLQERFNLFTRDLEKEFKEPESLPPKINRARYAVQTVITLKLSERLVQRGPTQLPKNLVGFLADNLEEQDFRNLRAYYPDTEQLTDQTIKWVCVSIFRVWKHGPQTDFYTSSLDQLFQTYKTRGEPFHKLMVRGIFSHYFTPSPPSPAVLSPEPRLADEY